MFDKIRSSENIRNGKMWWLGKMREMVDALNKRGLQVVDCDPSVTYEEGTLQSAAFIVHEPNGSVGRVISLSMDKNGRVGYVDMGITRR